MKFSIKDLLSKYDHVPFTEKLLNGKFQFFMQYPLADLNFPRLIATPSVACVLCLLKGFFIINSTCNVISQLFYISLVHGSRVYRIAASQKMQCDYWSKNFEGRRKNGVI